MKKATSTSALMSWSIASSSLLVSGCQLTELSTVRYACEKSEMRNLPAFDTPNQRVLACTAV